MFGSINSNTAFSSASPLQPTTLSLEVLKTTIKSMQAKSPKSWILIAPDGSMYSGDDPLVLAAQAQHLRRPFLSDGLSQPVADVEHRRRSDGAEL